jgi:hypothetical protein
VGDNEVIEGCVFRYVSLPEDWRRDGMKENRDGWLH